MNKFIASIFFIFYTLLNPCVYTLAAELVYTPIPRVEGKLQLQEGQIYYLPEPLMMRCDGKQKKCIPREDTDELCKLVEAISDYSADSVLAHVDNLVTVAKNNPSGVKRYQPQILSSGFCQITLSVTGSLNGTSYNTVENGVVYQFKFNNGKVLIWGAENIRKIMGPKNPYDWYERP